MCGEYVMNDLNIGDVVWAKRYSNNKQKKLIKINHREGPFIIIKKTAKRVYGIPCTSNKNAWNCYKLGKIGGYSKITYLLLEQIVIIGKYRFIKKVCSLDNNKINEIMNRLERILSRRKISFFSNKDIIYNYNIGNVVKYQGNKYYIYGESINYYNCIILHKTGVFKKNIRINAEKYLLDIQDSRSLSKNRYYEILENASNIEQINILEKVSILDIYQICY
jgi:hypothetical protein